MSFVAAVQPAAKSFSLTVGGQELIGKSPLRLGAIHVTETVDTVGSLTWSVEDTLSAVTLTNLNEVRLTDLRPNPNRVLFGGLLTDQRIRMRESGQGRIIDCTAASYDWWLDNRLILFRESGDNPISKIRYFDNDRKMVQGLLSDFASFILHPDSTIANTQTNLDKMDLRGLTLREALDTIGRTATTVGASPDTTNRHYYIDNTLKLHWYKGTEGNAAPYRIADGYYTTLVKGRGSLVELWAFRETTGATAFGAVSIDATLNGGYTQGLTAGMVNEPQMPAIRFNGTTGYASPSGATLHPGNTFSVECWFKRVGTGSQQALWSGGTGDVLIGFNAGDNIRVQKEGTGDNFVTNASYTDTDWHHLVVTRSPGTTTVYVDGNSKAGTTTAQTFVAGSGAVNIGRKKSTTDQFLSASIQHVALYSSELTAAAVLANYNQGISLTPEDLVYEKAGNDRKSAVYIRGKHDVGTGWDFDPGTTRDAGYQVQDIVNRPDSNSAQKREEYGRAYFNEWADDVKSVTFSVTGYDGWSRGQLLPISVDAVGLSTSLEIKQVDMDIGQDDMGNGTITYEITAGALTASQLRRARNRSRR